MLLPFQMREQPSPLITSSPPSSTSPLTSPQQQRVRALIDRYQILVLQRPRVAHALIVWVDTFMDKNGV